MTIIDNKSRFHSVELKFAALTALLCLAWPGSAVATDTLNAINEDNAAAEAKQIAQQVKRGRTLYQGGVGCSERTCLIEVLFGPTADAERVTQRIACGEPDAGILAYAPSACQAEVTAATAQPTLSPRSLEDLTAFVLEVLLKKSSREECEAAHGMDDALCVPLVN